MGLLIEDNQVEQACDHIVTFSSSHNALHSEKLFEGAEFSAIPKLISAPRSISSECGFCLLLPVCFYDELLNFLKSSACQFQNIYSRKIINGVKYYAREN